MISGTGSGVGKTSVTLGLVTALKQRGLAVQTFKVGPDFLDPTWLGLASGRPCYNLDGWMCGKDYVRQLFSAKTAGADIAVIEGVMGLFDGADPAGSEGSSAEIAKWLSAPVLLVVNGHGVARTLAATVCGFCCFEDGVRIAGVIANHTGSERHADWLSASLGAKSLPLLAGAVPRGALPPLPSRNLGLVTADTDEITLKKLDELALQIERYLKIDTVLQLARSFPEGTVGKAPDFMDNRSTGAVSVAPKVRIGIARDQAFHFYYQDNLEALEQQGAELIIFSPASDIALPSGLHGLYLGGGYPEEYVKELAANSQMLDDIRSFAASGRPMYAECGGMMYLSRGIELLDSSNYKMAGLLPFRTRMLPRRKALGYVEVTLLQDTLLGAAGQVLRGHEFHYSEIADELPGAVHTPYQISKRRCSSDVQGGYLEGGLLASYIHLHFASNINSAACFVQNCRRFL